MFILGEYSKHSKDMQIINIIREPDLKLYFKFHFVGSDMLPIIINAECFQLLGTNYFTNCMKYKHEQIIQEKTNIIEIKTEHDPKALKSVIESIKFNTPIVVEDANIDIILELINTYCLDMEDIKVAFENIKDANINTMIDIKTKCTLKCINCKKGYKEVYNTMNACRFHSDIITKIDHNNMLWNCCGTESTSEPCVIGYHIFDTEHFAKLKELYKIV